MKFTVFMKCPDALSEAVYNGYATDDEKEHMYKVALKFFKYGEYLEVEIDTDEETATVLRHDQ